MKKNNPISLDNILCHQWLAILDELNIGAFTVDTQRQVSAINYNAQALIGLRDTEAIGKDCREVFVGVPCLARCPLRGKGQPSTQEPVISIQDEDHSIHLVTRMASPVFGPDHQVVGCMTVLQDHSPIADLIDRIHYEEQSLKATLDNLEVGIFTVDRSGHITFFNTEAEKISGYNRREILGEPCTVIFEGENAKEVSLLKSTIVDGQSRNTRKGTMITKDGIFIPIKAHFLAIRNEKDYVVGGLITFQDITLVLQLNQAMKDRFTFHDMIGKAPKMRHIFEMIDVIADTDATILIEGKTGTGKDLLAQVIHTASQRSNKPFVKVNCASIPDNLIESEMFGYVKGAFTGAEKNKIGRFQEANEGTIFLDEIGELPLSLQAKLLRVLEDKEFYRLGSRHTVKVDVRILSASNRNLEKMVKKQLFREDLYYRLKVFRIELPDLKERRVDLPILIDHILRRISTSRGVTIPDVSEKVMEILLNYHYPGNVRELENILEHASIICQEKTIQPKHLPEDLHSIIASPEPEPGKMLKAENATAVRERKNIVSTLQKYNWHRSEAAEALDMNRTTLWRKIKKYGIKRPV